MWRHISMDFMEYRLSKFKNDIANQFGHHVFYNNVLIRVFYYLLEKRINTRILFLMTTYRRVLITMLVYIDFSDPIVFSTIHSLLYRLQLFVELLKHSATVYYVHYTLVHWSL